MLSLLAMFHPARIAALAALALIPLGCGGSSSETAPPLPPLPANIHYDRSATTLPGDVAPPERDAGASDEPADADGTPRSRAKQSELAEPTWGGGKKTEPAAKPR